MESLQKIIARFAEQLRGLTLSQRLAILLGGILVAVSLVWLAQWAATPEMVPLLDQELEGEELALVRSGLEAMNEPFEIVGSQVMVRRSTNRQALLAQLQQNDKLPADTSAGFSVLVQESNPWISQAEHERRWTVALQNEVERVLRQFANVKTARVFLNLGAPKRGFSRRESPATASVTLIMKGGEPVGRPLALAAARLVSGAVRGLPLRNVEVVDGNGVTALDWESEESGSAGLHRERLKHERRVADKIVRQLAFDPKIRVSVQVEMDMSTRESHVKSPTKPVDIAEESTSESTKRLRRADQPGVEPNVGMAVGNGGMEETHEKTTTKIDKQPGLTQETEITPPGTIKEIFAAVYVSYSYLEKVVRRFNPDLEEVTEEQIQAVFERERARIVNQVTKLVKPQAAEQVAVDWYHDTIATEGAVVQASSLDEAIDLAQRYGPQSGLALLALFSLALMLKMARRSDVAEAFGLELGLPADAIEAARRAAGDLSDMSGGSGGGGRRGRRRRGGGPGGDTEEGVLDAGVSSAIGQAAVSEGVLEAQEVDEESVRTRKMLEQIAAMVKEDAENMSAVLDFWIRQDEGYRR